MPWMGRSTHLHDSWVRSKGDQELRPTDIRGLLPICFPAVSDAEYSHGLFALIDLVDDSIVSNPDPPVIFW